MTVPSDSTLSTLSNPRDDRAADAVLEAAVHVVYPRCLEASFRLDIEPLFIGRHPEPGATIDHATVSRRHLEIRWDKTWRAHIAVDLRSHNGTQIDERRIDPEQRAALENGSVLQIGEVVLVYERSPRVAGDLDEVSRCQIPGIAATTRTLRTAIARAANDPAPVLLTGETGTGKEHVARELHRLSKRSGEWVPVNCAALSPELIESQLFGHVRGAFTGATSDHAGFFRAAHRGTLFLDEIGELPTALQAKLLRAIQEREVQPVGSTQTVAIDVRIIAATNRDLAADIKAGSFRRDLFARLALWEIAVPALRDRRADILSWLEILYTAWRRERPGAGTEPPALSARAAVQVLRHDWPDNLRGLSRLLHAVEVAGPALPERAITIDRLPSWLYKADDDSPPAPAAAPPQAPSREEFVRIFRELGGNVSAIARHFGRDRRQIYRWIDAHGLRDR